LKRFRGGPIPAAFLPAALLRAGSALAVLVLAVFLLGGCATAGENRRETARLYYNLGNAYSELGKDSQAAEAYESAWRLDSSLFQAGYNLARLHLASGRITQGRQLLEELLRKDGENGILLQALAWSYALEKDYGRAESIYLRVLELQPRNPTALYNLSRIYKIRENWTAAADLLDQLAELTDRPSGVPDTGALLLEEARFRVLGDQNGQALEILLYLKEKSPSQEASLLLGNLYNLQERYDEALAAYSDAAEKGSAEGSFYRGVLLLTIMEDREGGLKALGNALDRGFRDGAAAIQLLETPDFLFVQDVNALLTAREWDPYGEAGEGTPAGEAVPAEKSPEPEVLPDSGIQPPD